MNVLSILPDLHHEYRAFLNGVDCFRILPFEERVKLWKTAIANLESDVATVAEEFRAFDKGGFAWCFTWENHRNDGVLGTVYLYYMVEIIVAVAKTHSIDNLNVHASVPVSVLNNVHMRMPHTTIRRYAFFSPANFRRLMRPYLGSGRLLVQLIRGKVKRWNAAPPVAPGRCALLQSGERFSAARFNHFLSALQTMPITVFSASLFTEVDAYPTSYAQVFIPSYLNGRAFFKGCRSAIEVKRALHAALPLFGQNIFFHQICTQSFLQHFLLQLKTLLFEAAINHVKPNLLAVTASLADPVSRLQISVAHRLSVPTFMIACRSMVSEYRPEDRACHADVAQYNNAYLGDYFIVRDEFSRRNWQQQHISADKIGVQSKGSQQHEEPAQKTIRNGLILLFTQYENNTALCELVSKVKWTSFDKVYIRNHPNKRKRNEVGQTQLKMLHATGLPVEDISDVPMTSLRCEQSAALVVNSTSGVEVASTGAGVVWLPFISEHSLQFHDAMQTLGKVCYKDSDFITFANDHLNDLDLRAAFVGICHTAYKNYFINKDDQRVLGWLETLRTQHT